MLDLDTYFIKEKARMFKASNQYDIFDPQTEQQIMFCSESGLSWFVKWLRMDNGYKKLTPFNLTVADMEENQVVRVYRGWTFFNSTVQVFDEDDQLIGTFKQKWLTLFRQKFRIFDVEDNEICMLKAKNFRAWDFAFLVGDREVATVSKKWAGIRKEFFTTADNYVLSIDPSIPKNGKLRRLILAAAMTIDLVLKE